MTVRSDRIKFFVKHAGESTLEATFTALASGDESEADKVYEFIENFYFIHCLASRSTEMDDAGLSF
jgi:hypothetical protein